MKYSKMMGMRTGRIRSESIIDIYIFLSLNLNLNLYRHVSTNTWINITWYYNYIYFLLDLDAHVTPMFIDDCCVKEMHSCLTILIFHIFIITLSHLFMATALGSEPIFTSSSMPCSCLILSMTHVVIIFCSGSCPRSDLCGYQEVG